jgi:uncharacterized membrane protein (Fun14 family)
MTTDIIATDILTGGISGAVIGAAIGYTLKKAAKLLFKFIIIVAVFWIGSILYLYHLRIIDLNEKALDSLVNQSMNTANHLVNTTQSLGVENALSTIGVPLSSGLAIGFIAGWLKG